MKIRLLTAGGALVHDAVIPPFNFGPDVVTWGVRTFMRSRNTAVLDGEGVAEHTQEYREVFAYALVDAPG